MSATESSWRTVGGVPLYYVRGAGVEARVRYTAWSTSEFEAKCDRFVEDVETLTPYGPLREVWTAGAYVNKFGLHGEGRAFDLDGLVFETVKCLPYNRHHAYPVAAVRARYAALVATAHRHFRYVLHGYFDAAHGDHVHVDDGGGPLVFRKDSRSDVTFVQFAINEVMDESLTVDGAYGPATDRAFRESKRRAGVAGDTSGSESAWLAWNQAIAYHGFRDIRL